MVACENVKKKMKVFLLHSPTSEGNSRSS